MGIQWYELAKSDSHKNKFVTKKCSSHKYSSKSISLINIPLKSVSLNSFPIKSSSHKFQWKVFFPKVSLSNLYQ